MGNSRMSEMDRIKKNKTYMRRCKRCEEIINTTSKYSKPICKNCNKAKKIRPNLLVADR